jgi:predicted PhzF superfamily epimerase YddE/YHI9
VATRLSSISHHLSIGHIVPGENHPFITSAAGGCSNNKMKYKLYQIDAFAGKQFEGNSAAVVPLERWLPEATMQVIAAENNLSEMAFFVPVEGGYYIRWFTPSREVKLCGYATLASVHVIFSFLDYPRDQINFQSLSGPLVAIRNGGLITLDFPVTETLPCDIPESIIAGLGSTPSACRSNEDCLAIFDSAEQVYAIQPNHSELSKIDCRAVIVTALSSEYDFIARVFLPRYGIPEDSVPVRPIPH